MKLLLTLSAVALSFSVFSQYGAREIKKFRIRKLIKLSATTKGENVQRTEIWYDENGNDTAEYNNGTLYRRTKYEYNENRQAIRRTRFGADGNETETAMFTYKPDGSCTISNTDRNFGMTDLTYCDKAGKTTRTVSPDRSEKIFTYDSKGHLLKIKSKTGDSGSVVIDQQYIYNGKGQLIKAISKGDNKWTHTYTYGSKGLLVKCKISSVTDGVPDPEMNCTYEYEFRK